MSKSPAELAKELYAPGVDLVEIFTDEKLLAAFRGRFQAHVHPNVVAGNPQDDKLFPMSEGLDTFIERWRDWLSAWESWRIDPIDFREGAGGAVLVLIDIRARSRTESVEMTLQGANVLWVEDGLVTRLELHFDRADALKRVGLPREL